MADLRSEREKSVLKRIRASRYILLRYLSLQSYEFVEVIKFVIDHVLFKFWRSQNEKGRFYHGKTVYVIYVDTRISDLESQINKANNRLWAERVGISYQRLIINLLLE